MLKRLLNLLDEWLDGPIVRDLHRPGYRYNPVPENPEPPRQPKADKAKSG